MEAKQEEGICWALPVLSVGPEKGFSWAPLLMLHFALCLRAWRDSEIWLLQGSGNLGQDLDTIDIRGRLLCCGGQPVHCRVLT